MPIRKNVTHLNDNPFPAISDPSGHPVSLITLSLVIASLSGLLMALLYFTMRSYRVLSTFHLDDDCLQCRNEQHSSDGHANESGQLEMREFADGLKSPNSSCGLDPEKMLHELGQNQADDARPDSYSTLNSERRPVDASPFQRQGKIMSAVMNEAKAGNSTLYEAHFHVTDAPFACDEISNSLFDEIMTGEIKDDAQCGFIDNFTETKRVKCCERAKVHSSPVGHEKLWRTSCGCKINMVENPLDRLAPAE